MRNGGEKATPTPSLFLHHDTAKTCGGFCFGLLGVQTLLYLIFSVWDKCRPYA